MLRTEDPITYSTTLSLDAFAKSFADARAASFGAAIRACRNAKNAQIGTLYSSGGWPELLIWAIIAEGGGRHRCGDIKVRQGPPTTIEWAFALGLVLVAAGTTLWLAAPAWDLKIYRALHVAASARTLPMLIRMTDIGGAAVMIPLGLAVALWLAAQRRYAISLWLLATIGSGRILVELAKGVLARDRPAITYRLVSVTSASFPSSHSAGTMLTCLAIVIALRVGRIGWVAAALLSAAIGFSRVALGVHWPSDVFAGWGFGLFWAAWWARWAPIRPRSTVYFRTGDAYPDR